MASRPKRGMSEDLDRLIKAIGDCKSKSEEDRIMHRTIEATKATVKGGVVDKNRTRDFLVKLIYFEMLGHDSSFGHFLAVQACGSNNVMTKLVGYLAVAQFLDSSDSLILLLVNTWRSDLQNENHVIVCSALTAICKLVNGDAIGALVTQVVTLLSHPKEIVRKKAVMVLHRFCQIDPRGESGLAGIDVKSHFAHAICDSDPAVMAATLCGLHEMIKIDPVPFRRLIPSLTSIIKQVTSNRLSKSYEYHHCPAPFIQIHLLRVLALLGAGDKPSTDNMKNVLLNVLRNVNPRNTISFAVLFECIRTLTTVSPDTILLEEAARSVFTFLRSDNSHNLKYMGLDALGGIVSINFRHAQEHQSAVMDCLEDPDDTLKLKTLELLCKMTKSTNVEIVVEKLVQYLRTCTDTHVQNNICNKMTELAEKYAPDTLWYVETMIEMFEAAGDGATAESEQVLMKLISEQDIELHKSVVQLCIKLTSKAKLPKNLIRVVCWVLGEYGSLVTEIQDLGMTVKDVQETVCELIQTSNKDEVVQGYIISAISKLVARNNGKLSIDAEDIIKKSLYSKCTDLQQRALELETLVQTSNGLMHKVLPTGGSNEEMELFYNQIESLSFLEEYIQEALDNGATPYIEETERDEFGVSLLPVEASTTSGGLRFDAYQTPTIPQPPTAAEAPVDIPAETSPVVAEVPVTSFKSDGMKQEPVLKLPQVRSRRWGPTTPAETISEPPVIHLSSVKLEYSQPSQNTSSIGIEQRSADPYMQPKAKSERDLLSASLFGGTQSSARNGRLTERVNKPEEDKHRKSQSTSVVQDQNMLPVIDLLDLSDPKEMNNSSTNPSTDLLSDPFAGMDFSNGANGTSAPPQTSAPATLNLDAIYDAEQRNISNTFAPESVPQITPMMVAPNLSSGIGMKSGMGAPLGNQVMPKLNNQTKKDDPFKDLLG